MSRSAFRAEFDGFAFKNHWVSDENERTQIGELVRQRFPITFELNKPVDIESGMRFAMREGGKTVGAGVVTDVLG